MSAVFTYGSLMDAEIFARVCGELPPSTAAVLDGYRRVAVIEADYPAALPDSAASIEGLLYDDVSAPALRLLDRFEGDYYLRQTVTVVTASGRQAAETYVFREAFYHLLTGMPWSWQDFQQHGKARFLQRYVGFAGS